MGKKRERGKERKAKAAAQSSNASAEQAMVRPQPWRKCALVGSTQDDNRCIHGCPVLPAPDHVVSLFIDGLWADAGDHENGPICFLLKSIDNNRQVWDNATFRKIALDIMLALVQTFSFWMRSNSSYKSCWNQQKSSFILHKQYSYLYSSNITGMANMAST